MRDMKRLAELVGELEDQLAVCMRCGLCQSVCPVFAETGREADVARGKIALLDGLKRRMFRDPSGVERRLSRCLLCGSCAAGCPSGVKALDVFLKARAIISGYVGLSPAKRILFRGLLAHPRLFDRVIGLGARVQGFFLKPAGDLPGISCGREFTPIAGRHVKPLALKPFRERVKSLDTKGESGIKAAFFVGCLTDKVFPEIGDAVVRSLEHNKAGVFIPDNQGCCGMPALASGDLETFRKLVRHNLERFSTGSFDCLVTACATCTAAIRKIWPLFQEEFTEPERGAIREFAARTMDISQFLVDRMGVLPADVAGSGARRVITYHDPCHLKKSLGVSAQPRKIISANRDYSLKEMAEADRCCGCGGSFNLDHYGLSTAIGERKRACISQSGCSVVATSCPACMIHIGDVLFRAGEKIQVRHAIEIYAESLQKTK